MAPSLSLSIIPSSIRWTYIIVDVKYTRHFDTTPKANGTNQQRRNDDDDNVVGDATISKIIFTHSYKSTDYVNEHENRLKFKVYQIEIMKRRERWREKEGKRNK